MVDETHRPAFGDAGEHGARDEPARDGRARTPWWRPRNGKIHHERSAQRERSAQYERGPQDDGGAGKDLRTQDLRTQDLRTQDRHEGERYDKGHFDKNRYDKSRYERGACERGGQRRGGADRLGEAPCYAALDLGTNNCRLLIARPTASGFRVVDAFSRIVRLGEGLVGSGRLSDAAMARAIDALGVCAGKIGGRRIAQARLIATEACRAAANGGEFIDRVKEQTGLELEIVDRETEARLAAVGCTPLVDPHSDGAVLFDIGGGSTEVVWLDRVETDDGGPPAARIRAWVSVPLGVVSVAERHGGVQVTQADFEAMVAEFQPHLAGFAAAVGPHDCGRLHLLGTSGTVTTIAGVHLDLPRYDRAQVDGTWLGAGQVRAVVDRLLAMPFSERVANPCIGAERADLVLAGCAILEAVRRTFPCDRLRVADRGLREGILVELMRADAVWRGFAEAAR